MKRLVLLGFAVVAALGCADAVARDRPRGDGHYGRDWQRHEGRHWQRHDGRRPYYAPRPYYGRHWHDGGRRHYRAPYWGAYAPWVYAAPAIPLFSYGYWDWDGPVYVERIIEREPVYVERVYEAPPRHVERSYAQIAPPAREPARPAPAPAPRLERMTLSATELFAFDKAQLKSPQPKLDEIAEALVRNPSIGRVEITGYTDRIGSDAYNLKLSKQRADAVKAYLVAKGVEARRLVASGMGKADPVVQCNDQDRAALIRCLEPNRRVVVEPITVERRK